MAVKEKILLTSWAPGKTTPHKTVADGPFLYYKCEDMGYSVCPSVRRPNTPWGIPSVRTLYPTNMGYLVRPNILPHVRTFTPHGWSVRTFYPMSAHLPHMGGLSAHFTPCLHIYPTWGIPSVRPFYPTNMGYLVRPSILPHIISKNIS